MYVNICGIPVNDSEFIGVFDMDTSTIGKRTIKMLNRLEAEKKVENRSSDIPRSFIILKNTDEKMILSGISTRNLRVRSR